jgi:N-acetylglucosaminyldiphosphoundecaprenol N-acetyl-beta-D-mannosaminyltransferase
MGASIQERFLLRLVATGWSGFGFTCGGYLDQLVDGMHYYPRWVDAANLRWAYRLIREPRRLSRRYGMEYPYFAARLALSLLS